MQTIRVHFSDGDSLVTSINGTAEEIRAYYIGQTFNLGVDTDRLVRAVRVEFIS